MTKLKRIPCEPSGNYSLLEPSGEKPWLNLGCGLQHIKGFVNCDVLPENEPDKCFDMCDGGVGAGGRESARVAGMRMWPFGDGSVGYACSLNVFEHLPDILPVMGELWRVLRLGAQVDIVVPYWLHKAGYEDPTHVRQFGIDSSMYYSANVYSGNTRWYSRDRFSFERKETRLIADPMPEEIGHLHDRIQKAEGPQTAERWLKHMMLTGNMPGMYHYVLFRIIKIALPDVELPPVIKEIGL